MVDVAEVVVRASSDIDDAEDGLEEMEEGVGDVKEEMEDTGEEMGKLQRRFTGAMGAVVAGMAVSTGFLMSTVPVLGETMSAFGAAFASVGLRIDDLIRGPMQRFNDTILNFTDWMHDADGAIGVLANGIALLTPIVLGIGATLSAVAIKTFGVIGAIVKLGAAIKAGLVIIGSLLAGVALLPALAVLAVAGLLALAFVFREEIIDAVVGAVDGFWGFIDTLQTIVPVLFTIGVDMLKSFVEGFRSRVSNAVTAITSFIGSIADRFTDLVSKAAEWGKDLIQRFISGIKDVAGNVGDVVGGIELAGGVTVGDVAGSVSGGSSGGGDSGGFIGSVGGGSPSINIDGRSLDDNQGRFRKDSLTRRGG